MSAGGGHQRNARPRVATTALRRTDGGAPGYLLVLVNLRNLQPLVANFFSYGLFYRPTVSRLAACERAGRRMPPGFALPTCRVAGEACAVARPKELSERSDRGDVLLRLCGPSLSCHTQADVQGAKTSAYLRVEC